MQDRHREFISRNVPWFRVVHIGVVLFYHQQCVLHCSIISRRVLHTVPALTWVCVAAPASQWVCCAVPASAWVCCAVLASTWVCVALFQHQHECALLCSSINMTVKQGSLVAVVGTVGCGKSSLISACLGEMKKLKGHISVKVNGLAYCCCYVLPFCNICPVHWCLACYYNFCVSFFFSSYSYDCILFIQPTDTATQLTIF